MRTGTDDPQWQIILLVLDKNMMSFSSISLLSYVGDDHLLIWSER
jgi:hypothetical protein